MKTIKKVLVFASLLLLAGGLTSVVPVKDASLNEMAFDENNFTGINVQRGAILGNDETIETSKTFVQSGTTTYEGREVNVMRFATAIKGAIDSISYLRGSVEGADDVAPSDVTTVYSSITANGTSYYYDGTGLSEDASNKDKFFWAVYTIRFTSGDTFKYTNMTMSLTINGKVEASRTASLAEAIYGEHTHNYVNTNIDDNNHRGVCDACGTLGDIANHVFDQKVQDKKYLDKAQGCENAATYYKSCLCGAKGEELFSVGDPLGHKETNAGDLFDYTCSNCKQVRYRLDSRDYRVTSTGKTATKDGLGCTWALAVTADFSFVATKAEKVKLFVEVSHDTKDITFSDFYKLVLNGKEITSSTMLPKDSSRLWTTYATILLGEFDVKEGYNSLVLSYTPQKTDSTLPNYNLAFNLLSFSLRGEGEYDFATCGMCNGIRGCDSEGCAHSHCGCYEFNAWDSRTLCDVTKNDTEKCVGGCAAGTKITYYIHSDKETSAALYTNVSAIATSWEVAYNKTWTVTLNGEEIDSSATIHHNQNSTGYSGASDITRYNIYEFEFVNNVTLKAGINKIILTATGSEKLNMRDLGMKVDDAKLEFATYCPVCEGCALDNCTLSDKCSCGSDSFVFLGVDENVSVSGCFRKIRGAIGQSGFEQEGSNITFTVNASEATNGQLVVLLSSNTEAQNVNDVYGLTVNGTEVTTNSQTVVGTRWAQFTAVSFGEFALRANENTFNISYKGLDSTDAYNFLTFAIITESGSLSW